MSDSILELFGISTENKNLDWGSLVANQICPFLEKTCVKTRKSQPEVSIGTCTVKYNLNVSGLVICPHRFVERKQIFLDCIHLLTLHEPGNELHKISEVSIPGGSVDYFLLSVRNRKLVDFVGIELQALDTTGTIWPARQKFLQQAAVIDSTNSANLNEAAKAFGINWKMTAKTTLVQLHHKLETFSLLNKHLVLVLQENLLQYMRKEFNFSQVGEPVLGMPMHFHAYSLQKNLANYNLRLTSRASTDVQGIAACLGLQSSQNVELATLLANLQTKISDKTLLSI